MDPITLAILSLSLIAGLAVIHGDVGLAENIIAAIVTLMLAAGRKDIIIHLLTSLQGFFNHKEQSDEGEDNVIQADPDPNLLQPEEDAHADAKRK